MIYASVSEADEYLFPRPEFKRWVEFSEIEKEKFLETATIKIDTLKFNGRKTDISQENEFPRNGCEVIPKSVKYACIEEAYSIAVDENEERRKLISAGVTSFSLGDLSESYKESVDNFFLSALCRNFLNRYLGGGFSAG